MKGGGAYTIFVTLPNKTTHSVRRLPRKVAVAEVKAKLEVEVGIPSHVYVVFFGEAQLNDTDVIEFRAGVKNGVLLRLSLEEEWRELCDVVDAEDSQGVLNQCISTETETVMQDGKENVVESELLDCFKAATAMFIAAYNGYLDIVQKLLDIAGEEKATVAEMTVGDRGRCSLHAGAAGDQVQVLEVLLASGAHATVADHDGYAPADIAIAHGAYIAERYIRSHILRRKSMSQAICSMSREANPRPPTQQPRTQRPSRQRPMTAHPTSAGYDRPARLETPTAILASPRNLPFKSPQQKSEASSKPKEKSAATSTSMGMSQQKQGSNSIKPGNTISMSMVMAPQKPESNALPKRKPRIKSAPVKMQRQQQQQQQHQQQQQQQRIDPKHDQCVTRRPFMAFRSVPMEELRPETVEYVPLTPGKYLGQDQRSQDRQVLTHMALANHNLESTAEGSHAPCSSLNTSLEDISQEEQAVQQKAIPQTTSTLPLDTSRIADASRSSMVFPWKEPTTSGSTLEKSVTWQDTENREPVKLSKQELIKEYTRPEGTRTKRAQSARYYRSKFHEQAEEEKYYQTIPRPRPASAGPRYRAWKTWLLQKYEEDAQKAQTEEQGAARKEQCTRAFNRWLKKKYKQLEEQSDSEDSDDYSDHEEENNKAFDKWLESKREYFLKQKQNRGKPQNGVPRNSKMSVFQIGCTDETPLRSVDFNSYMRVHHKWYAKKKQYEDWKHRKGLRDEETKWTADELAEIRRHLVLQGCSYEEWMGQKSRERRARGERKSAKLHVTAFGETSPRKW